MSSPEGLRLFGVIHTDRLGKVTAELAAFGDDAEAIFLEGDALAAREYGAVALRAPFLFLGFLTYWLVLSPLFLALNRDIRSTEQVAVERAAGDRPVHYVDEHPLRRLLDASGPMIAGNWIALALFAVLAPVETAVTVATVAGTVAVAFGARLAGHRFLACLSTVLGYVAIGTAVARGPFSAWLAAAALLAVFVVVFRTIDHRNDVMLDRIETIAADAGYGDAVLVTGTGHLGGLVRRARDRELSVPSVHVSRWLRAGETRTTVDATALPEIGRPPFAEIVASVGPVPGTEQGAVRHRMGAALLDHLLISLSALALYAVAISVVESAGVLTPPRVEWGLLIGVGLLSIAGYYLVLEARYGATLGKMGSGLIVLSTDGDRIPRTRAAIRALVRAAEALFLYVPTLLAVFVSDRNRAPCDLAAGTAVARYGVDAAPSASDAPAADPSGRSAGIIRPGSERRVFGRRLLAGLVDSVLAGIAGFVALYVVALAHALSGSAVGDLADTIALPALLVGFVGYFLLLESSTGSTVGKRLLDLSVANVDGTAPSARQLALRNLARLVEVPLLYVPSLCVIALSGTSGRPGDLIAKTVVGRRARDVSRDAEWAGADGHREETAGTDDERGWAGPQRASAGATARSTGPVEGDRGESADSPGSRPKRND